MSMKKIRRRLSQTFRFSIEGSLSELAEHLTIEDGAVKENGVHVIPGFSDLSRKLSLSHSRIIGSSPRDVQFVKQESVSQAALVSKTQISVLKSAKNFQPQKQQEVLPFYNWF